MVYERDSGDSAVQKAVAVAWGLPVIDQEIRQAISHCWLVMPPDKKTAHHVEIEIRRLVERALKDLHDDTRSLGLPP